MFSALHALAQKSTLMITISAEDELLRVNVTPTPGDKDAKQVLRPLSLLGTAEELDADFAAAIATWQAPKQSLIEQARAAAEQQDDDDETGDATDKSTKATVKKSTGTPAAKSTKAASKATKSPATKTTDKTAPTDKVTLNPAAPWPFPSNPDGDVTATANTGTDQNGAKAETPSTNTAGEPDGTSTPAEGAEITGDGTGTALPPVSDTPQEAPGTPAEAAPASEPEAAASGPISLDLF